MKIISKRGSDSSSSDSTSDDAEDLTIHGLEGIVGQRLSGEILEKNPILRMWNWTMNRLGKWSKDCDVEILYVFQDANVYK